jgi:hypothetical protein
MAAAPASVPRISPKGDELIIKPFHYDKPLRPSSAPPQSWQSEPAAVTCTGEQSPQRADLVASRLRLTIRQCQGRPQDHHKRRARPQLP